MRLARQMYITQFIPRKKITQPLQGSAKGRYIFKEIIHSSPLIFVKLYHRKQAADLCKHFKKRIRYSHQGGMHVVLKGS
jgi:hypothetical protein